MNFSLACRQPLQLAVDKYCKGGFAGLSTLNIAISIVARQQLPTTAAPVAVIDRLRTPRVALGRGGFPEVQKVGRPLEGGRAYLRQVHPEQGRSMGTRRFNSVLIWKNGKGRTAG